MSEWEHQDSWTLDSSMMYLDRRIKKEASVVRWCGMENRIMLPNLLISKIPAFLEILHLLTPLFDLQIFGYWFQSSGGDADSPDMSLAYKPYRRQPTST